ncbi:hypothetical protein K7432_011940 [Basidiobolus ranarum]|uniref:Potassium transporter n=1 Tax=Basidiobolus ranarum TaxID=34480 RepID=A0ABR2WLN0_9FUNG
MTSIPYTDLENPLRQPSTQSYVRFLGLLHLAYKSTGIIYGDISTSPLYVFSGIFSAPPSQQDVYGIVSLIIWSMIVVMLFKYVFVVLRADDNGEGGTFALYSLLCRYFAISTHADAKPSDLELTHYDTGDSSTWGQKNIFQRKHSLQLALRAVVLFGASLVIGDGILTPAVSVLSAVEGIQVQFPSVESLTVPLTCSILICLFLVQRCGTDRIAVFFAPIITVWLLLLAIVGLYNISFNSAILKALFPTYALNFLTNNGIHGWECLGGVILAITGVEALFADLGHFNAASIRLSASFMVFPPLVLVYCGQGARLLENPELIKNAFWMTIPQPLYWTVFIVATLSTVVASQAMISATFSIINQAVSLDCFPRVTVKHTSQTIHGQIFIPEINDFLMIMTISIVIIFQRSTNLTDAYGVAVSADMFITTLLVTLVMIYVWKVRPILYGTFLLVFGIVDGTFLSAALLKLTSGGWLPLTFALIISGVMNIWYWGTSQKILYAFKHNISLLDVLHEDSSKSLILSGNQQSIQRVPGFALFYSEADVGVPATFTHFINSFSVVPQVLVFVTIRHVPIPYVLPKERYTLTRLNFQGFYRCVARYGYMETVEEGNQFANEVILEMMNLASLNPISYQRSIETKPQNQEQETLLNAVNHDISFILSRYTYYAEPGSSKLRRWFLHNAYAFLHSNMRAPKLNTPHSKTIELGIKVEL